MTMIAPSVVCADLLNLKQEILLLQKAGADLFHIDVMDGCFVNNITFGFDYVKSLKKISKIPLFTHLMIVKPERYVERFIEAGSDLVTFHIEATGSPETIIDRIHSLGKKVGVAYNPETEFVPESFLKKADLILIMTVHPGFSHQKFIEAMLPKIKRAKEFTLKTDALLEVDGGVNRKNAVMLREIGVDILVACGAIFDDKHYEENISALRG